MTAQSDGAAGPPGGAKLEPVRRCSGGWDGERDDAGREHVRAAQRGRRPTGRGLPEDGLPGAQQRAVRLRAGAAEGARGGRGARVPAEQRGAGARLGPHPLEGAGRHGLFSTFGLWFSHSPRFLTNIRATLTTDHGVFVRWILNTVLYAAASSLGAAFLAAAAGYGFAKYRFRGHRAGFNLVVGTIMVPTTALAIPTYLLFSQVGLVNTPWAVILPSLINPFGLYLMRIYAQDAVPDSLIEAARIDGAGEYRIFFRIALRLLAPGLVTVLLFTLVTTRHPQDPDPIRGAPGRHRLPGRQRTRQRTAAQPRRLPALRRPPARRVRRRGDAQPRVGPGLLVAPPVRLGRPVDARRQRPAAVRHRLARLPGPSDH
jgi:Binding-protein-dependent transport system inner membrane component